MLKVCESASFNGTWGPSSANSRLPAPTTIGQTVRWSSSSRSACSSERTRVTLPLMVMFLPGRALRLAISPSTFNTIVTGAVDQASGTFQPALIALRDTKNLEQDLRNCARLLLITTMDPRILQLRRLVIAEASRFPAMGGAYYEQTYERTTALLASTLQHLAERGLLNVDDAALAAQQLIWLTFIPRNKVMLCGDDTHFTTAELHRYADAGVRVFLAAYGQS